MSSPSPPVQFDAMAYVKSFVLGGAVAAVFYMAVDAVDMGTIPQGPPMAFVAGGLGAVAGPMILAQIGMSY